jgi:folate-binding protein YgfZ
MSTVPQSVVAPHLSTQIEAALHGAVVAHIDSRAFLRITGPDATRWLNGMVTNSIPSLSPGEGNYNFILNAQGRILGDCTIYREPSAKAPEFLLETDAAQIEAIQQHLDKFIIMDDVELTNVPGLTGMLLLGPNSSHQLTSAAGSPLPAPGGHASRADLNGQQALILTPPSSGTPVYEVWFDSAISAEHTFRTFSTAVGMEASPEVLEALRILEGRPRYGIDIRNSATAHDLPQETGQTHALHFAKGCYLGQEIVERIRSRGNVHRTFSGFRLEGTLPAVGTAMLAEGKPVGELTSVATIPLAPGTVQLALGYIRRESLDHHLALEYPGGKAFPISLPYEGIS